MAQLVHFYQETGTSLEYVVIDDDDLPPEELEEEYGEPGYTLGDVHHIDGDVTSLPTNRSLRA
jgi:hypothetical protein